jgi:hypothetical protein
LFRGVTFVSPERKSAPARQSERSLYFPVNWRFRSGTGNAPDAALTAAKRPVWQNKVNPIGKGYGICQNKPNRIDNARPADAH